MRTKPILEYFSKCITNKKNIIEKKLPQFKEKTYVNYEVKPRKVSYLSPSVLIPRTKSFSCFTSMLDPVKTTPILISFRCSAIV